MNNLRSKIVFFLFSLSFLIWSCADNNENAPSITAALAEADVINIQLAGPAADSANEFSGLAWRGDYLILLPQFPNRNIDSTNNAGILFSIPKERIISYLDGSDTSPIEPDTMKLYASGLQSFNSYGSGYEAIVFDTANDYTYCALESNLGFATTGYLVKGYGARLDPSTLVEIESQSGINNLSEEAIFIFGGRIYTIHEANGKNVNPNPVSHSFHLNLADEITIPFPNIEYRITDATAPDDNGKFWVINYFWEGDSADLKPAEDELVKKYGIGETNEMYPGIERLIQLQVAENGIELVDRAPIYLKLNNDGGRNWEGIAKLDDRGLLIVTDKFPSTILGFVKF
ncbi:MAG: hypothetical protein GXO87_01150 [Chlorobi bacterium]|nr:hypothetical protein [Chlorobiota bacterium]